MKKREMFISNSSSSSFCIAKCYMTEEQQKEFRNFLNSDREDEDGYEPETWIGETKLYFQGSADNHDDKFREFINELNLEDFVSYYY